jgi:hypothetical protein
LYALKFEALLLKVKLHFRKFVLRDLISEMIDPFLPKLASRISSMAVLQSEMMKTRSKLRSSASANVSRHARVFKVDGSVIPLKTSRDYNCVDELAWAKYKQERDPSYVVTEFPA